jgi:hypothetical protein
MAAAQLLEQTCSSWGGDAQHHQQQVQQVQRQSRGSDSAAGGVSLDDVCLDMVPEHVQEQAAAVPEQDSTQQHSSVPQEQPAQAAAAAAVSSPAADAGSAAGRRSTAAQLAATMEQFRQSAQQMQQLWVQLQSLSLDSDEACKLQHMLTPHKAASAAAAGGNGLTSPRLGSSSSQQHDAAEPVQLVKQLVQEEVLQTIYGLHAAVTGVPSSATGPLIHGGLYSLFSGALPFPVSVPYACKC